MNSSKNASMNIRNGSYKLAGAVFLSALSSVFLVAAVTFASPATGEAPAAYVPDEIIVKFGKTLADRVKEVISKGRQARDIELSDSLDELHKKYRLRSAKPLFKNFKRDCQRLEALHKKDKTLLTKKEKQILRRLKRAAKDATVPDLSRIYKITFDLQPGQSIEQLVAAYDNSFDVEYAELNYIVSINLTPTDPLYALQWPLNNIGQMYPESGYYCHPPGGPYCDIDAPEAWDIETGSSEVIIAVVDTGVDYNHRDLQGNMWTDPNGCYGHDFVNNDNDPMDDHGHGTHCAGIIAAAGDNGLDITGVCWNARIMALKTLGSTGRGDSDTAAKAFYYAAQNGADVISNSWGGGDYSETMKQAIDYAYSQGVIMVASAGNNNSGSPEYPACYEHMMAVAATDSSDQKASFSNYGDWVDMGAPGVDILSLRASGTSGGTPYDDYTTTMSGTSMACPHVAGGCGLLLSTNPTLTNDEIHDTLMATVDPIAPGTCVSDGRLNLFNAMLVAVPPKGRIALEHYSYSCSSVISIMLADCDLAGVGSQEVTLTTSGGDSETVVLTATVPALGVFAGSISTSSGDPNTGNGMVQVAHEQIITVTYEDSDDGTGTPATVEDTATVDCESPIIYNVQIGIPGAEPKVTLETNEPTKARLLCTVAGGEPNDIIATGSGLSTSHAIKLKGVLPETDYFFVVEATDIVGNETVDNNDGQRYSFTTTGPGSDIYVPSQYSTIQEAIDNSWECGTVWVADGTYTGQGNRDIDFRGKAITVLSINGPNNCIIDCQASSSNWHRGFYFRNGEDVNSIIDGFTITNGYHKNGGGIVCQEANPQIVNCIISGNKSKEDGGGMYSDNSSPTVTNCTFSNNESVPGFMEFRGDGGGMYGNGTLTNCTFNSNIADEGGGMCGSGTLTNCTFSRNSASYAGGGMYNRNGNPTLTNCIFSENLVQPPPGSGPGKGGGVYNVDGNMVLTNCTLSGNIAGLGGGMYSGDGATLINCVFEKNTGSGIRNSGNVTINDCIFMENSSGRGGGIQNYGDMTISNSIFMENSSEGGFGGGIHNDSAMTITDSMFMQNSARWGGGFATRSNAMVTNCTFIGNSALDDGGGISCRNGSSTIRNCRISANSATYGGGIHCSADSLTLTNCMISENTSGDRGGGLYFRGGSLKHKLTNCIISANTAEGGGGGICTWANVNATMTNCTIINNRTSSQGGGIRLDGSQDSIMLTNCILWGNSSGQIYKIWGDAGVIVSYSDVEGGWEGQGNIDADPAFVEASSSEPNEWDLHLLPGSPCIDAGTNNPEGGLFVTDMEENLRPLDGDNDGIATVDMGAYEFRRTEGQPVIGLWSSEIVFATYEGGENPDDKILQTYNAGAGTLEWIIEENSSCEWLEISQLSGSLDANEIDEVTFSADTTGLASGEYNCQLTISDAEATNSPQTIEVNLFVWEILYVPLDYPTIQAAINAANPYGAIIVGSGIYNENISFGGKIIALQSTNPDDPGVTVIQGDGTASVVTFSGSESDRCVLSGFTITGGGASGDGGGIRGKGTEATITNCVITGNSAIGEDTVGGGLADCDGAITNCIISENSANGEDGAGGGLVYCDGTISNCTITGNSSVNGSGGGLRKCGATIINCIIADNFADEAGGGLASCNGMIINCTITGNIAEEDGGGLAYCDGIITNCIITGNTGEYDGDQMHKCSTPTYSCFPGASGSSNIDADPCFADPNNGDYHLKSQTGRWDPNTSSWVMDDVNSPCIDAGDPSSDWAAELWPHGKRINMGAFGGTPQASMSLSDAGNIADLSNNDIVDYTDLIMFTNKWLYQEALLPEDLDRNGLVNFIDFAIFANCWIWGE